MATRTFKNETKIDQVYYDSAMNPHLVRPGESYTEDLKNQINVRALAAQEMERQRVNEDVDEAKRVKIAVAAVKATTILEELEKYEKVEKNPIVIETITEKKKELLAAMKGSGKKEKGNVQHGRPEGEAEGK